MSISLVFPSPAEALRAARGICIGRSLYVWYDEKKSSLYVWYDEKKNTWMLTDWGGWRRGDEPDFHICIRPGGNMGPLLAELEGDSSHG